MDEVAEAAELGEADAATAKDEPRRTGGEREGGGRRRRRRRGGRGRGGEPRDEAQAFTHDTVAEHAVAYEDHNGGSTDEEGLGQPQTDLEGTQFGEGEAREGGRRRRRRGRRGGRRNRQRNGDMPPFAAEPDQQPEYRHAIEETNQTPPYESAPAYAGADEQLPAVPPAAAQAPGDQEVSRRRSTIREPAPFANESAPPPANVPPPTPIVSSSGSDEPAVPKRGWWGKRRLGDK